MGEILHKPALSIERVITDITPEMLNDFEALNNIANTLYSGNSVINLDSEIAEAALTKLLDKNCTIKTITLYIPKSVGSITVKVDDPSNVTCYQNQSKVTYIDKSINEKSFEFDFSGDDMTRIDYFKNESDVILYITGYTYLEQTSNN
jgi:hypothetical protein